MNKLVLISGSPGSGKTTLATILAKRIGYEFINSDNFLEKVWLKHKNDSTYDRESIGMQILFDHIETEIKAGKRIVTDVVLVEGKNETMLESLLNATNGLWIHCTAEDPLKRYKIRETLRDGSMPSWFAKHYKYLQDFNHKMRDPIKINQRPIIVNTDNDYQPSLEYLLTNIVTK